MRPATAFELVADKWNDEAFNPVAPVFDCHQDFFLPTNCGHSEVSSLARVSPQKVEDALAAMRSNLLRIIQNWERSGQGEGGQHAGDQEDEEHEDPGDFNILDKTFQRIGLLTSHSARALQSRAAFLLGKPLYLLYFWEIADPNQLLQSCRSSATRR